MWQILIVIFNVDGYFYNLTVKEMKISYTPNKNIINNVKKQTRKIYLWYIYNQKKVNILISSSLVKKKNK